MTESRFDPEDEAFNEIERRSKVKQTLVKAQLDKPKREWVGLTDEEMLECNMDSDLMIDRETAKRNVEAKLKEKNA
jgi:hypothetical protein